MRVLLAGATGAIGRPLVPRLIAAGHEVTALTRRPERVAQLEAAGARAVVCDVTDRAALLEVARRARPEVVLDETTDLPQRYDPRRMDRFYSGMVRLRLFGTPNLMDAASLADARFVFQSIAFLHQPGGQEPKTEDDPLWLEGAPSPFDLVAQMIAALEQRTVDRGGTVLRYGVFYGPGTHLDAGGEIYESVRRRRFPIIGGGHGRFSFVHVDDAADATVRALAWDGGGIVHVVDDDPIALRDWLPVFAREIGARPPLRIPAWLGRLVAGPVIVHWATAMAAVSNARARAELGWAPAHPSVRGGFGAAPPSRP